LAVAYIAHGYYFYVAGWIPEHKAPVDTDAKILAQYDLALSKWTRCRRRKAGAASVQYLRYGRFYVLLATHGEHPFFTAEARALRDIRLNPIYFMGYSIGCRQARGGQGAYHASVRLDRTLCQGLKRHFEAHALRLSVAELAGQLQRLPYEHYAPVRAQLRGLMRAINRRRKAASLDLMPSGTVCLRRSPVRPFG
jgi:hypothetical protein